VCHIFTYKSLVWTKNRIKTFLFFLGLVIGFNNLEPSITQKSLAQTEQMTNNSYPDKSGWHKNLNIQGVLYDLYIPATHKSNLNRPCILLLPGWNFPRTSWVKNTNLVAYADQYGYALLLPEMGKTIYENEYYPQTTLKWNTNFTGGKFIKEIFIPEIQKRHNLLKPGQDNMLLGLSTGGRGVVLIALENPGLFVAGASLSGDFNQTAIPSDRLMIAVYGPYDKFKQRWNGEDNPQTRVKEWVMPLYLAHGVKDNIVPESQSKSFYEALQKANPNNKQIVEYHPVGKAAHDYQFWGAQLEPVFKFFESVTFQ